MVQELRPCTSTARGAGLTPGQGTGHPACHTIWPEKKKKQNLTNFITIGSYFKNYIFHHMIRSIGRDEMLLCFLRQSGLWPGTMY